MTLQEASNRYFFPVSRLRRAIKFGWLKVNKEGGKYIIDPAELDRARKTQKDLVVGERQVVIRTIHNFLIQSRTLEKFETNKARDEFKQLFETTV